MPLILWPALINDELTGIAGISGNESAVTASASSLLSSAIQTPLPLKRQRLPEMISASTQTDIYAASSIDLSNAGDEIRFIDASNPNSNRNSSNVDAVYGYGTAAAVVFTQESAEVIL